MQRHELERFLSRNADVVAKDLIGCTLMYEYGGSHVGGIIVETEAYDQQDPASHTFHGRTKRNDAMFGPPGNLYIYFIYGMHFCMNIVTGDHDGEAVLLRALEPTMGIDLMMLRRQQSNIRALCSGPAKLVQALGVPATANNTHLREAGFDLLRPVSLPIVTTGTRIGITKSADTARNFRLAHSPFVST